MEIYILLVLAIIFLYFFTKILFMKNKLIYCLLIGLFLYLIIAFRGLCMGEDLKLLYVPYFKLIQSYKLEQVFEFCKSINTEFFYYFINYIISRFTQDVHIYIAIVGFPFIYITTRYIYKYSNNALLSFLIFISLNYYCYAFSALRHTMAAAFIVLSYDYIVKQKKMKFIACILVASLMHRSAIIFLIAYPICNFKVKLKQLILIFISLFGSLLFKDLILKVIFTFVSDGHFALYKNYNSNLGLTFFFMNILIYLFIYYLERENKDEREIKVNLNLQFLCVCFSALVPMFSEMMRISYFFGIFATCSLPNAINRSKHENRKKIYNVILAIIFIFYFLNYSLLNNELVPYVSLFD